jgi:drug/metabolite transporter (DMT)-like permease
MNANALLALLFTVLVWGIGPVFIRTLSVTLGPGDHLAIRYALASIGYLIGLAVLGGVRIESADWPRLLFTAFIGMLGYSLGSAFGFAHVSAGMGSLIIGTQPLLIALLATLAAKERLTPAALAGLVVAFAGTALLVWNDLDFGGDMPSFLLGASLIFGSGIAWAIYVVAAKPLIVKYGSFSITALTVSIAGAGALLLLARSSTIVTLGHMSLRSWLEMLYMALGSTLVATVTWNYGAGRLSATATGAFLYLVPIIGVAAGAAMLGETITPAMLTGGGLIMLGVAIAQFGPLMRRTQLVE